MSNSPTTLSLLLGVVEGRYEDAGFDAGYTTFAQAGDAVPAVVAGDRHVGAGASEFPTIGAVAQGADELQIIGVTFAQKQVVGLVARDEVQGPADLVGRAIGVPFGTGTDYWRSLYFAHHGIDDSDVDLVNVSTADTAVAFIRGDVDAIFTFQPFIDQTLADVEGAHVVAWAEDDNLWNGHTTMFTTKSWLDQNHEAAVRLLRATKESADWINDNYEEAIALAIRYLPQDEETIRTFLVPTRDVVIFESPETIRDEWIAAARFMQENDMAEIDDPEALADGLLNSEIFEEAFP